MFKTSFEIDQRWLLELAADRTPFIDQAQSLNLFIPADVDKWDLMMLHFRAWELGIKSLYYLRSKSVQRAGFAGGVEADNTPELKEIQLASSHRLRRVPCVSVTALRRSKTVREAAHCPQVAKRAGAVVLGLIALDLVATLATLAFLDWECSKDEDRRSRCLLRLRSRRCDSLRSPRLRSDSQALEKSFDALISPADQQQLAPANVVRAQPCRLAARQGQCRDAARAVQAMGLGRAYRAVRRPLPDADLDHA